MTESNGERNILTASKHMGINSLREIARTEVSTPVDQLVEGQKDLIRSMEGQRITLEQFLGLSQKQSKELVESFKKVSPREERERWVDAEYAQDFYTRFTPNLEPSFYTGLSSEERSNFDSRWQLARAAFYKQATSGFPDKYRENQDLSLLGKEKMESLYKTKGVKEMLQGYTRAIIDGDTYFSSDGKELSFWEIRDAADFEALRVAVREKMLGDVSFEEEMLALPENIVARMKGMSKRERENEKEEWVKLFKKEADAIAWNWIWVSNLAESADSRYSNSGAKYSRALPSTVTADEYKFVLHPQERFEGKCINQHHWKAFGRWGVTQVKIHMDNLDRKHGGEKGYEIRFAPAKKGQYWEINELPKESPRDTRKEKKAKVYQVRVPECYPVTTTTSFLENTQCKYTKIDGNELAEGNLLKAFMEGNEIVWSEVAQDAWAMYLFGKFHKAYQLLEYWDGIESGEGKPIELGKPFAVKVWADPLNELFVRLDPKKTLDELESKDTKDSQKEIRTYQTFSNLKVWAAMVGTGGVSDINSKNPKFNIDMENKLALSLALKHRKIKYLKGGEQLAIR